MSIEEAIMGGIVFKGKKDKPKEEEKEKIREELHLNKEDAFAITVGNLIKRKNQITLIEAVNRLDNPHFHLFICGDGQCYEELKKAASDLGIRSQIHFLGFRKDVEKLCGAADIFLFASVQEGLPVAVMEAMACGLPIVASKIRGNSDLIDSGKGGYLVQPKDVDGFAKAIISVIKDKKKVESMENYNFEKIKEYSKEKVIDQMAKLYESLM